MNRVAGGKKDAIVIGGGFYGCLIALYLVRKRGLRRVVILEREKELLSRASMNNQARVHRGYHYPRSYTTAYRSGLNSPKFISDFSFATDHDFCALYAVPKISSKVTARQFRKFCQQVELKLEKPDSTLLSHFDQRLIEEVFVVNEPVFDAGKIKDYLIRQIHEYGIEVEVLTTAIEIGKSENGLSVEVEKTGNDLSTYSCNYVMNCTYSGLSQFHGQFGGATTGIKHEVVEIAVVEVPDELDKLGITVMDGSFFSLIPFPQHRAHSLTHVRYTPHESWIDSPDIDPYSVLTSTNRTSRVDRMRRDASRYVPALKDVRHISSVFEVKTVLLKNEIDDGRPILFEKHNSLPGFYSVLGGKIDNIYDVLLEIDREPISPLP